MLRGTEYKYSAARTPFTQRVKHMIEGDGRAVSVETRGCRAPQLDPSPVGGRWGIDFGARGG